MGPGPNVRLPGYPLSLPGPRCTECQTCKRALRNPACAEPPLLLSSHSHPRGSAPVCPFATTLPAPSGRCRLAQASHQMQFLSSSKASSSFRVGTHAVITLVPLPDCPPPRMSLPGKATACHLPGHTAQGLWNEVATS